MLCDVRSCAETYCKGQQHSSPSVDFVQSHRSGDDNVNCSPKKNEMKCKELSILHDGDATPFLLSRHRQDGLDPERLANDGRNEPENKCIQKKRRNPAISFKWRSQKLFGIVFVFPDPKRKEKQWLASWALYLTIELSKEVDDLPRISHGFRAFLLGETEILRSFELEEHQQVSDDIRQHAR